MTSATDYVNGSVFLTEIRLLTREEQLNIIYQLRSRGFSEEDIGHLFHDSHVTSDDLDLEVRYMQYPTYRAHKFLLLYVPPVLLILGSLGNVFSFFVLRHKSMNRQSIYVYLSILAVFDILVLYIGLLRQWIGEVTGSDIRDKSRWLCKGIIMAGYTCSDVSVWLIVAVTVERYIAVCHPLRAPNLCQESRAKKIVLGIVGLFALTNLHLVFTVDVQADSYDPEQHKCYPLPGFEHLVTSVWPWVDALLYGFGPFILISVLNFVILAKICHANRSRGQLVSGHQAAERNTNSASESGNIRMTAMLLTVSFTFLLTTLPMNISSIVANVWINTPSSGDMTRSRGILFRTVASLLMYLNHSANFLLYCVTGRKFRGVFCRMFWLKICRGRGPTLNHSHHIFCSRKNGSRCGTDAGRSCNSAETQV